MASVVISTMGIYPEEKLGNALLAVKGQDVPGSHMVSCPSLQLHIPQGLSPKAQTDTMWDIRLHSWPQKYGLFTVHSNTFYHLYFFFGLADRLLTSVRSAAAVSCSKILILLSVFCRFIYSDNRVKLFALSLHLIKHVIVFFLFGLDKVHEM